MARDGSNLLINLISALIYIKPALIMFCTMMVNLYENVGILRKKLTFLCELFNFTFSLFTGRSTYPYQLALIGAFLLALMACYKLVIKLKLD